MATVQRYVNTASTAGGDGTTNGTDSGDSTRAYATLAEWEANAGGSATDDYIVDCCGTTADATCTIDFTTNLTTGTVTVRGNRSDGAGFYTGSLVHSTSHYRVDEGSGFFGILSNEDGTTIDGIQIKQSKNNASAYAIKIASRNNAVVRKCRAIAGSSGTGHGIAITDHKTSSAEISNCLAVGFSINQILVSAGNFFDPTVSIFENTAYADGSSDGITCSGTANTEAVFTIKGNAVANSGTGADIDVSGIGASDTVTYADNALEQYDLGTTDEIDLVSAASAWTSPGTSESSDFSVKDASSALYNAVNPTLVTTDITDFTRDGTNHDVGAFELQAGTTYFQTNAGSVTAVGTLRKSTHKPLLGTITGVGVVAKSTSKFFSGSTTLSGDLSSQSIFTQAVEGSITAVGALGKKTLKQVTGAIAASGALSRTTYKLVAGTLTISGTLVKSVAKNLAGVLTAAGAVATQVVFTHTVGGSLTAVGTLVKKTHKALVGNIVATGRVLKNISISLAGSITAAGALATSVTLQKAVAGALTIAGALSTLYIPFSAPSGILGRVLSLRRFIGRR